MDPKNSVIKELHCAVSGNSENCTFVVEKP